jgi:hypothetical protein
MSDHRSVDPTIRCNYEEDMKMRTESPLRGQFTYLNKPRCIDEKVWYTSQ